MAKAKLKHEKAGLSGHVKNYDVFISGDTVKVTDQDPDAEDYVAEREVEGLGEFIGERMNDLKLGWAEMPDFEIIYIYDPTDDNFGYAVNLSSSMMSEWGYAPFGG